MRTFKKDDMVYTGDPDFTGSPVMYVKGTWGDGIACYTYDDNGEEQLVLDPATGDVRAFRREELKFIDELV